MENENKESKSNGMELLENVVKSNMENTEQNIKLQFAIENHTTLLNNLKISLENGQSNNNETVVFFKLVQAKITELIAKIPTQTEMVLSKETKDYLDGFGKNIRWKKKFIWSGIGVFVFAFLILIISTNFSINWYKESIRAKSELRQDILNEIANEGKKIYDKNEITILRENTQVMQLWIKNNPKKAEDFLRFKDGFKASRENN
ncbi:Uncharacterised protein [Chryseobacterium indoltheticum]|uniref:Uncharacterized protein n=2 Tax=Chryseobacterium indoltheticum TaxID=254 RepID=A0A381FJL6_9FLAO|nr:Uncharacterised protein [Chryseobacterium indoltheticum]